MQQIQIIGFIGQDAKVNDLGTNQVINFSVAVSESYVKKETGEKITNTIWYDCSRWGNNTQIAQYLKKGQQVFVSGTPTARAWQNENGEIKSVLGIKVDRIELLGSDNSNSNNSENSNNTQNISNFNNQEINNVNNEEHDDLPFN